ncbi:hypothetical protein D3C85_544420 [compost metagenome]
MESTGAHFHVVGLEHHTALLGPVLLQGEDQVLEGAHGGRSLAHEFHLCWVFDGKCRSIPDPTLPQPHGKPYATLLLVQ